MKHDVPHGLQDRAGPTLYCDLTQSWSAAGGGVGTYIRRKRKHILDHGDDRHLLIIPGDKDEIIEDGRTITATIKSPKMPGSPNYRLLLRNSAVRRILATYQPDLIECQDAYNLPWAAISHARRNPGTALVAAYCTDFPTAYVEKPARRLFGQRIGGALVRSCYRYCGRLYGRFDALFALSENGGASMLRTLGLHPEIIPFGVDLANFSRARRNHELRASMGLGEKDRLLIYAGRLDREKRADLVLDAFRAINERDDVHLLLVGDGPLRAEALEQPHPRIHLPGYVSDRDMLATMLASSDLYVSGMGDETFGISVVEAQASGLPVIGVAAGAMLDRVTSATGLLGPVGDVEAMAANIIDLLDRDLTPMRKAAQEEAKRYDWSHSMDRLFAHLYPLAQSRAALRERRIARRAPAVARA